MLTWHCREGNEGLFDGHSRCSETVPWRSQIQDARYRVIDKKRVALRNHVLMVDDSHDQFKTRSVAVTKEIECFISGMTVNSN